VVWKKEVAAVEETGQKKLTSENLFTTCEDDDTDVVIVLCLIELLVERVEQRRVERVECFGSVEGEDCDLALA
jgi:hypothetical protein